MNRSTKERSLSFFARYGLIFLLGAIISFFVCMATKHIIFNADVEGNSMSPMIHDGDKSFGIWFDWMKPKLNRGDIISFFPPVDSDGNMYMKRIIGLPGETVIIRDGKVYVDGGKEPLDEPYLDGDWTVNAGPYLFEVPDGCYLVLGDNRNGSYDSRYWACPYVEYDAIQAKTYFICHPGSGFYFP